MILFPALAFISGLWLGSYLPFFPSSIILLLSVVGVTLTFLETSGRVSLQQGLMVFASLISGVVYWTGAAWIHNQSDIQKWMAANPVTVTGTIIQPVRRLPDRHVMVLAVSQIGRDHTVTPASGNLLLTWRHPDQPVFQGNQIEVTVRLRQPYGTVNPGGFHYGTYLKRKGIQAVGTVSGPGKLKVLPASSSSLARAWNVIDQWRYHVQQAAAATLQDPVLGLFLGMIIGEQGFLAQEVRDDFMTTGTVHIISISGSHLGLIAFLTFFLVRGLVLRLPAPWLEWLSMRITATRLAVLATLPLISFYTLLAGAETATVRSWIMIVIFLLAVWLGRERNILTVLIVAAVVVLLHNPQALYDISFQLSYGSVLAIAFVIQVIHRRSQEVDERQQIRSSLVQSIGHWITQTSWITLAVVLATVPLVAYDFNQIAWLGLVANLVVVPYVGFVVVPLGLMSAVWVLLTGAESLPLGFVNQSALEGLGEIVRVFAMIPGAEWHVASPAIPTMLTFYGLLVLMMTLKHPKLRWGCAMVTIAILALWIWSPRLGWTHGTVRVTFLDVGQGDATVIELPDGQTVLIDAGPSYSRLDMGRAVVGPYLWDRGIRRIDHVIATHPQWDHVGGLPWVIKTFDVGHYWSNGVRREKQFYQRVQEALAGTGVQEEIAWQGQEIAKAGECRLDVVNPPAPKEIPSVVRISSQSGKHLNNQSIITKLDCGRHAFLFTADAEREALWRLNRLPHARTARVVKVPHHGAGSSLNHGWINHLDAEAAIISVGRQNRYGHPAHKVLEAYNKKDIPVYRTDEDGAVWITALLNSPDLNIETARQHTLVPVQRDTQMWEEECRNWKKLWLQWASPV